MRVYRIDKIDCGARKALQWLQSVSTEQSTHVTNLGDLSTDSGYFYLLQQPSRGILCLQISL